MTPRCDPELGAALTGVELPPFFALSWVITWWAHNVPRLQVRPWILVVGWASSAQAKRL